MAFRVVCRVALGSVLVALAPACGPAEEGPPGGEAGRDDLQPVVSATIPVGGRGNGIEAVAVGEGGVWVAGGGECPGTIWRIDPDSDKVVEAIAVDNPHDLAVGEGAVWVLGGVCAATPARPDGVSSGAVVYRIDPASNELAATTPLDPPNEVLAADVSPSGVAFGEGAVWVSLSYDPWAGEVIRVDPRSSKVVARTLTQGFAGELTAGAGAVWVLGHPEYTDETDRGESLHRIDPRTNELVSTPLRDERLMLGGYFIPPTIVADGDAAWVNSSQGAYPHKALAIRVDARTNVVTRERLPTDHFFPFAATEAGVWSIGPGGELSSLDPRTFEFEEAVKLGAIVGDAAFDPAKRSFWIAAIAVGRRDQGSIVRVDLR